MDKRSPHTRAADLAASDMRRVIASFTDEPFMSDGASSRTRQRRERIASSPDAMSLVDQFPMEFLDRVARAAQEVD